MTISKEALQNELRANTSFSDPTNLMKNIRWLLFAHLLQVLMIVFIIVFACMPRNNMDSEQIFAFIEIGLIVLGITYVVIILLGWIVRSAARTYESLCKKNIVKRYTIFLFIPLANFANIPIYFAIWRIVSGQEKRLDEIYMEATTNKQN